ncbi:MAG: flavodoxin family protein [Actinomycetota bacterium]
MDSASPSRYDDLSAVFLNTSLSADAAHSHTMRLMRRSAGIMRSQGVAVDMIHMREHFVGIGMVEDAGEQYGQRDEWPTIQERIFAADIFVLGTPIWLGAKSSVATLAIERMYAYSGEFNDNGQWAYYGKTAGCVVTGNEDGVKACARDVLYALQHIGYTIPPQADCGWIGEAGPGPSYGDVLDDREVPVGYDNEFTMRNTTFMSWNLMHTARMLKDNGGLPAYGNVPSSWTDVPNATQQSPDPA